MKNKNKQIVIDRLENNLSWNQIAKKYNSSSGAVRSRYFRAALDYLIENHQFTNWLSWAKTDC